MLAVPYAETTQLRTTGRSWADLIRYQRPLFLMHRHAGATPDVPLSSKGVSFELAAGRFDQGADVNFDHLQGSRRRRFFLAAETALALPESEWPQIIRKPRIRSSREDEARFHALKKKRDTVAAELHLDPSLIAPKSMLENLANNFDETAAKMMPWQRERLGV